MENVSQFDKISNLQNATILSMDGTIVSVKEFQLIE